MSNRPRNTVRKIPSLATNQLSMNKCLGLDEGVKRFNPSSEKCRGGSREGAARATNVRRVEMVADKAVNGAKAIYCYVGGVVGQRSGSNDHPFRPKRCQIGGGGLNGSDRIEGSPGEKRRLGHVGSQDAGSRNQQRPVSGLNLRWGELNAAAIDQDGINHRCRELSVVDQLSNERH